MSQYGSIFWDKQNNNNSEGEQEEEKQPVLEEKKEDVARLENEADHGFDNFDQL